LAHCDRRRGLPVSLFHVHSKSSPFSYTKGIGTAVGRRSCTSSRGGTGAFSPS
jgi:hypothetical protein